MPRKATKERGRQRRDPANLLTSVVLVLPLLIFYEVGVLFTDTMNGADLVTQSLLRLVGQRGFLLVQLGLVLTLVGIILYLRSSQQFQWSHFVPVLLESAIYALTMGTLIIFLMTDVLGIDPSLSTPSPVARASIFDRLVMSIGAGVHEEFVFRLLLMGGLLAVAQRLLDLRPWLAVLLAVLVSSLIFSAAHHIGPLGEPLRATVFIYRTLAGVFFALLYRYRSFAIAVYTHAIYDIYVMIFV